MKQTIENNKKFAKFMGYVYVPYSKDNVLKPGYWTKARVEENKVYPGKIEYVGYLCRKHEELAFHLDWEWLMEVVEKIERLDCREFSYSWINMDNEIEYNFYFPCVHIEKDDCQIYFDLTLDPPLYIADEQEESKKEAVYKAALKFIDWYYENENNNKG